MARVAATLLDGAFLLAEQDTAPPAPQDAQPGGHGSWESHVHTDLYIADVVIPLWNLKCAEFH